MWIKFVKDFDGSKSGDIVWSPNNDAGQWLIDNSYVKRCLGPDGVPAEYFPPEDVVGAYAKEDGVTFEEEELIMKKKRIDYGESEEVLTTKEKNKIKDKMPTYYNAELKSSAFVDKEAVVEEKPITEEPLEGEVITP
jgi:hypothetical protein